MISDPIRASFAELLKKCNDPSHFVSEGFFARSDVQYATLQASLHAYQTNAVNSASLTEDGVAIWKALLTLDTFAPALEKNLSFVDTHNVLSRVDEDALQRGVSDRQALIDDILRMFATRLARRYCAAEPLVEALAETTLKGLTQADVKLPAPFLYVALPRKKVWLFDESGKAATWYDGLLLTQAFRSDEEKASSWLLAYYIGPDQSAKPTTINENRYRLFVCRMCPSFDLPQNVQMRKTSSGDSVSVRSEDIYDADAPIALSSSPHNQHLSLLALNLLMYITSAEPDCEIVYKNHEARSVWKKMMRSHNTKAREKLARKLDSIKDARACLTLLGSHFSLNRTLPAVSETSGTKRGPILYAVRVAGHWRNQPCGKGRQDRKHIWIAPFWRGDPNIIPAKQAPVVRLTTTATKG